MKAAHKKFEPVTYEGAGHGFMRAGEDPTNTVEANKTARTEAFARMTKLLKEVDATKHIASATPHHKSRTRTHNARTPEPDCHDMPAMHVSM